MKKAHKLKREANVWTKVRETVEFNSREKLRIKGITVGCTHCL